LDGVDEIVHKYFALDLLFYYCNVFYMNNVLQ